MDRKPDFAVTTDAEGRAHVAVCTGPSRALRSTMTVRSGDETVITIVLAGEIATHHTVAEQAAPVLAHSEPVATAPKPVVAPAGRRHGPRWR